jgi:hypothetical protein
VHNNRDILSFRTLVTVVLAVCLLILIKKFLIREENYVVWIGWFSSGAESFYHSCTSCFLYLLVFVNKDSILAFIHTRDTQLSKKTKNECQKTFV